MNGVAPRAGGLAFIVAGLAWVAWFYLESAPPRLGFDDTDNPAVSLQFLREHATIYAQAGLTVIVMAIALVVGVLAVTGRLASRADPVALHATTAFGLFSAAFFLGHGVIRMSAGPMLHIDSLNHDWGEAAYVAVQMVGTHLMAAGGLLALSIWAAAIAVLGWRTGALPRWLSILAVVPAMRLVSVLGPLGLGDGPDVIWLAFMASILGTGAWLVLFGVALLRRPASEAAA